MGLDATFWVVCEHEPDPVRLAARMTAIDELLDYTAEDLVRDRRYDSLVYRFETTERYYGPDYPRGNWPVVAEMAAELAKVGVVHYCSDEASVEYEDAGELPPRFAVLASDYWEYWDASRNWGYWRAVDEFLGDR